MSYWLTTIDERYGGYDTQNPINYYDAPSYINDIYVLASNSYGYGYLGANAYAVPSNDTDVYSLGLLYPGTYVVDVDEYRWDFTDYSSFGFVSEFSVTDSLGIIKGSSYSSFNDITFNVTSTDFYYVHLTTSPLSSGVQYSVLYSPILSNSPAIGSSPIIYEDLSDGLYRVGENVSADLLIMDADGYNVDNIITTWYLQKNGEVLSIGTGSQLEIPSGAEGGQIGFDVTFFDYSGNLEYLGPYFSSSNVASEMTNNIAEGINPVITQSLIDGKYSVGEIVTGELSINDADGFDMSNVVTTWFLDKAGIQTTLGVSDQLIIPENAEGGIIGFSKSFTDAQGNNETLGPYYSSTQVTSEIQITKTNIQLSDYSNDYDVQVLLESDPFQYKWGGNLGTASNLTYSFSNHNTFVLDQSYTNSINTYTSLLDSGYTAESIFSDPNYQFKNFTDTSKDIIRDAFDKWTNGTGVEFVEIDETTGNYGDIRLFVQDFSAWSSIDSIYDSSAGFSYMPGIDTEYDALDGDVFLDETYINDQNFLSHLIMHELGHSLGMAHPHDGYLAITGDNSSIYNDPSDIKEYQTVMSYDQTYKLSDGLMPLDIKAAEYLYGGNTNANLDDNNYLYNQSDLIFRDSIIDRGGDDTLDFSALSQGAYINLSPDSWSSMQFSGDQSQWLSEENWVYEKGDIYISENTIIENIIGTNSVDIIYDNDSVNNINAGLGSDIIYHHGNADFIDGGDAIDTLHLVNKSFSDITGISINNESHIIHFNDYDINVANIENIYDNNASSRVFSELASEYLNTIPSFTPNDTTDTINGVEYFTFPDTLALGSVIGIVSSVDNENDPVFYTITGGNDQQYFEIETINNENGYLGLIKTKSDNPINYDVLKSLNGIISPDHNDTMYVPFEIEISVSDYIGSTSQLFNAALFQSNTPPIITSPLNISFDENLPINTVVYDAEATDANNDNITYSLGTGGDSNLLRIDSDDGEVRLITSADFETKSSYTFEVIASDGELSSSQTVIVNINNLQETPTITSSQISTVNENVAIGSVVHNVQATDPEGVSVIYSLGVSGDSNLFNIDASSGEVIFLRSPDFETKSSYTFEVIASDGELSSSQSVTLNVVDEFDGRIFDQTDNYYEINVNQTSTVYGLYDGNDGYDQINFVVDNGETNGTRVDFTAGIQSELNSAFVSSYGVDAGSVGFEINDFEKLSLTDETDYMIITDAVGINLTDQFNTEYFTTSQSVLTIDPGEAGTGTDRLDVDKDSQIHLSYESLNSTTGINVNVSEATATVTGVDVNTFVDGLIGTGQVIDRLTTTNLSDTVANNSSLGMVVDLGGSINAEADRFTGSIDPDAIDVLDAREAYNLDFSSASDTVNYDVRVLGTNQSNEQKLKAELKLIDMIMVSDVAAYGITDVDFYVDLSDIYGTQQIQGLGAGSSDTYGEGYDVQTSAKVSVFGDENDLRVYYDGRHTDFVDTGDIIDTTLQGQWSMVDGAVSNGADWEQQVADSNPTGGEGSFFIVVGGKKIAVTHVDGEWVADNTSLSIAQNVTSDTLTKNLGAMSEQQFIASIADRYGLPDLTDPYDYSFTNAIYLNGTEQQINDVLGSTDGSLTSEKSFNFGFYTKVNIGDAVVNLKISQSETNPQQFNLNWDDVDLIVETFYNRVETVGEGVSAGGAAANFVKVDNANDIAMGNGGNDTYVIGSNDVGKVAGGTALEYGDVSSTGGLLNSESDSVNFADIESITELDFVRGKDRNERADSSLFISEDGGSDATVLFDNFNPYLDFRRIEYLTIDDAGNNNEIFEISVDGNGGTDGTGKDLAWNNEIVVANNQGDTIYADGGTDVLVGGQGADTFDLSNVLDGSTVYIENFTANDNAILKEGSSTSSNTNTSDGVIYVSANNGAESYYIYTDADDEQLVLDNMTLAGG